MNKKVAKKEEEVKLPKTFLMDELPGTKISVFIQTVIFTLASIAIFGALGYYLDQKLETSPVILIVAVVVSYPFTQFILFRRLRRFAQEKVQKAAIKKAPLKKKTKEIMSNIPEITLDFCGFRVTHYFCFYCKKKTFVKTREVTNVF